MPLIVIASAVHCSTSEAADGVLAKAIARFFMVIVVLAGLSSTAQFGVIRIMFCLVDLCLDIKAQVLPGYFRQIAHCCYPKVSRVSKNCAHQTFESYSWYSKI